MIIKNKLTGETLNIPYFEFRTTFSKEINVAFESYRKTQLNIPTNLKMIILQSLVFTLTYSGTLIILV